MSERLESEQAYQIPHYLAIVYLSAGGMALIGIAVFALKAGDRGFIAALPLAGFATYATFAIYMQQWNPHGVALTPEGLRFTWTLGARDVRWEQVESIDLRAHRVKPAHVAQLVIRLKNHRRYSLQDQLSNFDELVNRLRTLHPELIRE